MENEEIKVLRHGIERLIDMGTYKALKFREFAYVFDVHSKREKSVLSMALNELISENRLVYRNGRYHRPDEGIFECTFENAGENFGFALPEEGEDIFITRKNSLNAFTGDTVLVEVIKEGVNGLRREGRVLKITKKVKRIVTGNYIRKKGNGIVVTDGRKYPFDIPVYRKDSENARTGDKVRVQITGSGYGKVLEILGRSGFLETELAVLLDDYSLSRSFDEQVLTECEKTDYRGFESLSAQRKNLVHKRVFTIDGKDARDLDDAVGIEREDEGYVLYVHIADVSNYVKPGSFTDRCAYERSVSTYLPEFVIPMLPERLSNNLCSLNANEKKKTLSARIRIDSKGRIRDYEFFKAEIVSDARLDYDSVNDLFEGKKVDSVTDSMKEDLLLMRELYRLLKKRRVKQGMIDFDTEESKVIVEGGEISIVPRRRGEAEELIEHFMLTANECAAEFISSFSLDSLYRIHEKPKKDSLDSFIRISKRLGYPINARDFMHAGTLQSYLDRIKGEDYADVLRTMLLRCMSKARYSPDNMGHFALSIRNYTHFTSPIRRYPDLVVHRIISKVLEGDVEYIMNRYDQERLKKMGEHLSRGERKAEEAEREAFKLYACKYLENSSEEVLSATVSGFSNRGAFVRLDSGIEGLCPFTLMSDYYEIDADRFSMTGQVLKEVFTMCDRVEVTVFDINLQRREIEFILME